MAIEFTDFRVLKGDTDPHFGHLVADCTMTDTDESESGVLVRVTMIMQGYNGRKSVAQHLIRGDGALQAAHGRPER